MVVCFVNKVGFTEFRFSRPADETGDGRGVSASDELECQSVRISRIVLECFEDEGLGVDLIVLVESLFVVITDDDVVHIVVSLIRPEIFKSINAFQYFRCSPVIVRVYIGIYLDSAYRIGF